MKKNSIRPRVTTRIEAPIAKMEKKEAVLYCPFCKPTHKIVPGLEHPCGTRLEVRAVQEVYKARYDKTLKCAKCGRGDGEMVRFQAGFIHTHDCTPGVAALTEPPKFSMAAKVIYNLKWPRVKSEIEKRTGRAMKVDEVTPEGARTGNVLGYTFLKG